jgi:hypothetical protein
MGSRVENILDTLRRSIFSNPTFQAFEVVSSRDAIGYEIPNRGLIYGPVDATDSPVL